MFSRSEAIPESTWAPLCTTPETPLPARCSVVSRPPVPTLTATRGHTRVPARDPTHEATDLQALLAQKRDRDVNPVAIEVSSHALDQHRVDGPRFAAVTFTNLTHEHLDYLPSVEAYFDAKALL